MQAIMLFNLFFIFSFSALEAMEKEDAEFGFNSPSPTKSFQSVRAIDLSEMFHEEFYFLYQEYQYCINLIEEIASSEPEQGADLINIFSTAWKKQKSKIKFTPITSILQQIERSADVALLSRDPLDKRRRKEFDPTTIELSPFVQFKSVSNHENIKSTLFYLEHQNRVRNGVQVQFEEILNYFKAFNTPIKCFKVSYPEEIRLQGVFEEFRVGHAIQDENCFFHAIFTTQGASINAVSELANQLRQTIYDQLKSNAQYQDYIRLELKASYSERENTKNESSQIGELIVLNEIMSFAKKYVDSDNPSSVDIPISNYGLTAIIACIHNLRINYYKYNTENHSLYYYRTIGEGSNVINLLCHNDGYYPLFNPDEEEKAGSVAQAFVNYYEERHSILSSLSSMPDLQRDMSLLSVGTPGEKLRSLPLAKSTVASELGSPFEVVAIPSGGIQDIVEEDPISGFTIDSDFTEIPIDKIKEAIMYLVNAKKVEKDRVVETLNYQADFFSHHDYFPIDDSLASVGRLTNWERWFTYKEEAEKLGSRRAAVDIFNMLESKKSKRDNVFYLFEEADEGMEAEAFYWEELAIADKNERLPLVNAYREGKRIPLNLERALYWENRI